MAQVIYIKPGVRFSEFNQYFFEFTQALYSCARRFGHSYRISSAHDGKHCDGSYHYRDTAWDVGLKEFPASHWYVLHAALKVALPGYFDLVIEGIDNECYPTENLHLHVEADLSKVADALLHEPSTDVLLMDHSEGGK